MDNFREVYEKELQIDNHIYTTLEWIILDSHTIRAFVYEVCKKMKNESKVSKKVKCQKCNDTGEIEYYHDAGDHFGAGRAPGSEWKTKPYDCKSE